MSHFHTGSKCFLGGDFLRGYLGDYMWVFYLGVGLNVFCVTFMMILVFAPGLAKWIMVKGLKIIEHVRILKPRKQIRTPITTRTAL